MKITTLLCFLSLLPISASIYSQNNSLTLKANDKTIKEVLDQIEQETKFHFLYNDNFVDLDKKVNFEVTKMNIQDVLSLLLEGSSSSFKVLNNNLVVIAPIEIMQQLKVIGTVTDGTSGEPIIGANVIIQNTTVGTTTDVNGKFSIDVSNSNAVLVISSVGYMSATINVDGQTTINVKLAQDITKLEEVIVIGYGSIKKSDLTGAVGSVKISDGSQTYNSVDKMLQGMASGVAATSSSNTPGGGMSIRIRGTNSISGGSDPLYVVDGVPLFNNEEQLQQGNPFGTIPKTNTLSLINPEDIESISILKDASSTAIYGARGANGVVLITTKSGKKGQAKVEFSANYGVTSITKKLDMLNAKEFMELNNAARLNSSPAVTALFTDSIKNAMPYDTNWQDELYRKGKKEEYNLNFSGGNDNMQYLFSLGYANIEGIVKNTGQKKYNIRANIDRQIGKALKIGTKFNVSRSEVGLGFTGGSNGVIIPALQMVPIGPKVQGNGFYFANQTDNTPTPYSIYINNKTRSALSTAGITQSANSESPLYFVDKVTNNQYTNRFLGSLYGEITLLPGLSYRFQGSADVLDARNEYYAPNVGEVNKTGGKAFVVYSGSRSLGVENRISYVKDFGPHSLNLMAVQEALVNRTEYGSLRGEDLNDATSVYSMDGNKLVTNAASLGGEKAQTLSFAGRAVYSFDKRYMFTATLRRDGASQFGANHKWGTFYSFALAWNLTNETFMSPVSDLFTAKIRASYGINGNSNIGLYNSLALAKGSFAVWASTSKVPARIGAANMANPNLSWETAEASNLGIDLEFLKGRIGLSFDVYNKNTLDLLLSKSVSALSGYTSMFDNIGEVNNKGFEISLTSHNLTGNFSWLTSANFGYNKNKIIALQQGNIDIFPANNTSNIHRAGEEINSYYGYVTDGIFQVGESTVKQPGAKPGDRKYKDINGDGTINSSDRVILGNTNPKVTYGFSNTFSYKSFELYVFFNGAAGSKVWNQTRSSLFTLTGRTNALAEVKNYWTPTNTSTNIPRAIQSGDGNSPYGSSVNDIFVEDNSFIRLKSVTLSYNFKPSMLKAMKINGLRLAVSGENLWTGTNYTGYDPEVTSDFGAYPNYKAVSFSVNVTF